MTNRVQTRTIVERLSSIIMTGLNDWPGSLVLVPTPDKSWCYGVGQDTFLPCLLNLTD